MSRRKRPINFDRVFYQSENNLSSFIIMTLLDLHKRSDIRNK